MKFFNEKGAISLSDFFLAGISALFVGALAVPFILGQQSNMNEKVAQIDARSIATEVELFLQSNQNLDTSVSIAVLHNPATQELLFDVPALPLETKTFRLPLSNGSALLANGSPGTTTKSNLIISSSEYCITVTTFGRTASHNQNGPIESCN